MSAADPPDATVAGTLVEGGGGASSPGHLDGLPPRYAPLGRLGRGGTAEVFAVQDHLLGQRLALKVLRWDLLDAPGPRRRFEAEARVTAALRHPGVVPVIDAGVLPDGRPWFAMAEVDGETFGDVVRRLHDPGDPTWGLRAVVERLARAAEAVAAAHAQGVVHRDLKPDNVMIGAWGEVTVMDWGLALEPDDRSREGEEATGPGVVVGSPAWMAPEQARGDHAAVGPHTDVYALGAMLYAVLSGQRPYPGEGTRPWQAVLAGPPTPLHPAPDAAVPRPEALVALCHSAMARDPATRPSKADAVVAGLRAWLDGEDRRQRAILVLDKADASRPEVEALAARAATLHQQATEALGALPRWASADDKAPGWALLDQAEEADRAHTIAEAGWLEALHAALRLAPGLPGARRRLADHHLAQLAAAEANRDAIAAARAEALARAHATPAQLRQLTAPARVWLETVPAGVSATWHPAVAQGRRLVAGPPVPLGETPLDGVTAPAGPGHVALAGGLRVPALLRRGEAWRLRARGERDDRPLHLPQSVSADEVFVPPGWTWVGGDPAATDAVPRQQIWLDGCVIGRDPVTCGAYLRFLAAVAHDAGWEAACGVAPRAALGDATEADTPLLERYPGGLRLREPGGEPWPDDHPVVLVDWHAARAYAAWRAEADGLPWRLPFELEWETAARGADGRFCPWGDHPDPAFARLMDSHRGAAGPGPVGAPPFDQSPTGVRGLGGNVRDWCLDAWTAEGPPIEAGRPHLVAAARDDPTWRVIRGGAWLSQPDQARAAARFVGRPRQVFRAVGFRLARPWPSAGADDTAHEGPERVASPGA